MFETLVTGLLTSALGSYIEPKCFSSDKINVAVWSGYVVLTELEIRSEVLADFPAVKLVRGIVGSIELKIPWNRLQSDSVVATVDDVYLLLRTEEDIDSVMRHMDEFTLQKRMLEELYTQAKRHKQTTEGAEIGSTEDGFAARLINKIIDNLELHIRRIHIRIEDYSTGEHPFAVGLAIESVHVQSTNSHWQPTYVDTSKSNEPRIYKSVDLNHLSVYCNPDCKLQRDHQLDLETCSVEEFLNAFSRSIPKRFDDRHYHHMQLYPSQQQHHFILKPVDANARLIVNRDVFDTNVPKFEVDVKIYDIAFRLEESQYCDLLYLASVLQAQTYHRKYYRFRKFRPQANVLDEPAQWWKYAITSVTEDLRIKKRQWTWEFMQKRREDRKHYVTLWQHKSRQLLELSDMDYVNFDSDDNDDDIHVSDMPKLSFLEVDGGLEEIERRRSIEDILFFRYLGDLEIQKYQALRATRDRHRLPTPPSHTSRDFSDTASLDTDITETSVPAEIRYRSWGAWMFGWTSRLAVSSTEEGQMPRRIIPEVELRELFNILEEPSRRLKKRAHNLHEPGGQDSLSDGESQIELSELFRITISLQRGSLTLASDPETNVLLLRDDPHYGLKYTPTEFLLGTFSHLQLAAVAKDETVVVDMSLQSIEAFDESAESSAFSRLVTRKQSIHPTGDGDDINVSKLSGVVFLMSFEMHPVNSNADASLFIHMEPLEIVMSPTARCWGRLAKFLETPGRLGLWEELEVASFNNIVNLKTRTEAKLNHVMDNRVALAMDLRIQAPVIIVPESDTDYSCARLVVDLGRINLRTDHLCQKDKKRRGINLDDNPLLSKSEPDYLRSPSYFHGVDPNTSFVQHLSDEVEKGEGAGRWKEEFYDKFSLSVTDIHVLIIPYGNTIMAHDSGAGGNGMTSQPTSFLKFMPNNYDEEKGYELIERFNINFTIRMSSLPLDATLTRFYVHADLPALTFNVSLEKYFQLVALAGRFSVTNTEKLYKSQEYRKGEFDAPAYKSFDWELSNSDEMTDAVRKDDCVSASTINKFMLRNTDFNPPSLAGVLPDNGDDSDKDSSIESDDTWFSITSGNVDLATPSNGAGGPEPLFSIDTTTAELNISSTSSQPKITARNRLRPSSPNRSSKLLDRRFFVCSFTVPLIVMQLEKPRLPELSPYLIDSGDFDVDPADNGSINLKLQGFRIRASQKTLSTQVNVSLTSFEVEDISYSSGRSSQFLLFSCPSIAAPFSITSPSGLDRIFPGYFPKRRQPTKQRPVITHGGSARLGDRSRSEASSAPETVLKLAFSSFNEQCSGKEVLREVDIHLGSVQFIFDQSYVCSLLELFEQSSSQLRTVPDLSQSRTDGGFPPPVELAPTIEQEYSIPVNLTESVRADLERARRNIFGQSFDQRESASLLPEDSRPVSCALKFCLRLHSVSLCLLDGGESIVSVAFLSSQLHVSTDKGRQIKFSGLLGDVRVFDLTSIRRLRQKEDSEINDSAYRRFVASSFDYIEIIGSGASSMGVRHILSVECLMCFHLDSKSLAPSELEKLAKSKLCISVRPIRLLAQPEFMENLAKCLLDGPLYARFYPEKQSCLDAGVMVQHHKRVDSLNVEKKLTARLTPFSDRPFENSTPFFDAVDASNREPVQLNLKTKNTQRLSQEGTVDDADFNKQCNHSNDSTNGDDMLSVIARLLDGFDLDITLCHPSVVFPSISLRKSLQPMPSQGIILDLGIIAVTLRQENSNVSASDEECAGILCQVNVAVDEFQIRSIANQISILERSGFQMRCMTSIQAEKSNSSIGRNMCTIPEIVLDLKINPVCLNVSEAIVCLVQEIYHETIISLADTAKRVHQNVDRAESISLFGSLREKDGHLKDTLPAQMDVTVTWGQVTIHFFLVELKVALISFSEAPQEFEVWMKNIIDLPDEVSSRASIGGASFMTQEKSFHTGQGESTSNEIPCCVIGEFDFVSCKADVVLNLNCTLLRDSQSHFQCDFSLDKAIFCDKIADSTVSTLSIIFSSKMSSVLICLHCPLQTFLTHLYGPVPGSPAKHLYDLTSAASISSQIPTNTIGHALLLPPASTQNESSPQLIGRLVSDYSFVDGDKSAVTTNSLEISVSSARFIFLPRTLLRLEHFVFDIFLAASKKRDEFELQLYEAMANKCDGVENTEYFDDDVASARGEKIKAQIPLSLLRPRTDSLSEVSNEDIVAVRSTSMSPLQRILTSTSAVEIQPTEGITSCVIVKDSENSAALNVDALVAAKAVDNKQFSVPRWKVNACLSNSQIWMVSTDRKADMAACVFSCNVNAKFDSTLARTHLATDPNHCELVNASVMLSDVEVLILVPAVSDVEQQKPIYQTGTLVEKFEADFRLALRQCSRPDPENIDPESGENIDSINQGIEVEVTASKKIAQDSKDGVYIDTVPIDKSISESIFQSILLARQEPTLQIDQIISHISYQDLPLLLKVFATLTNMLRAENEVRGIFLAQLGAADNFDSADVGEYSEYAHHFGADDVDVAERDSLSGVQHDILTRMSVLLNRVHFCLINNIVDQASPVVEFETKNIELVLRADSSSILEVAACCTIEAKYRNLRLVTMEPLIEPWSVKMMLYHHEVSDIDDKKRAETFPWRLKVSSDTLLQLNLTDALIANLVAADRAWRWVHNAGSDSREMTEYSTYWIRNNTGMPLRYWLTSGDEQFLAPGQEKPLRFHDVPFSSHIHYDEKQRKPGRLNANANKRQLFIAVEEEYPSDNVLNFKRKWQSEVHIPVDQVDSRMFALVDTEAESVASQVRKCECVIDVFVERGCKYFVVRSTLLLENQTSSDLEVEFVSPQVSMSRSPETERIMPEHTVPVWKKIVKAFSVVPVPVHLVSYSEWHVLVRPPINDETVAVDGSDTGMLPRAYAKERVKLPLFDRSSVSAFENMPQMGTNESVKTECTIKFRRLHSDRPVRPFMMNACLSSASDALYHRTLSFYPPLIVHNLTAGPLDFCLATPSDWSPAAKAVPLANAGDHAGWETREQRLRERGTINVADSLFWHLSSEDTPLVLSVRMKRFDWSETLELKKDLPNSVRIGMKDLVSNARLYVNVDIRVRKGYSRELILYVPYWIVNLTGLKLEYEYEKDRMGWEHSTSYVSLNSILKVELISCDMVRMLAGQKRLDRDEILLKEIQSAKASSRESNPHIIHPILENDKTAQKRIACDRHASRNLPDGERKRRHPRLLPSLPPIKGLLDLLPKSIEHDLRNLGQLQILQVCHSSYKMKRSHVRLRVSSESETTATNVKKENGQRSWSNSFMLDQVGTSGEIEAIDFEASRKFCIGYSILPAKGQFSRTKVIMLTPRFVLVNTMSSAVEVCHSSPKVNLPEINATTANGSIPGSGELSPLYHIVHLESGAFADFHWSLRYAKTRTIRCRFAKYGWSWSGAVPLVESGEYAIRMRHGSTRESKFVRITLKLDTPSICVYFREESTTTPPYRVENYSLETLRMHQHRVRRSEILLPHHSLDYAWDEPTEERLLVVDMLPSAAGDNSRPLRIGSFDLDRIQRYPDALGGTLGIELSTDGPTRVLRFTDTRLREERAVQSSTNNQSIMTEKGEINALHLFKRYVAVPTVQAVLHLQGVGISIVDNAPKELMYISASGIALDVLLSKGDQSNSKSSVTDSAEEMSRLERQTQSRILACCLKVSDIQIDNQLQGTSYPVFLRFSNPNGQSRIVSNGGMSGPVMQVGLVKHDEYAGIDFIRHFSVSILPVHIRVDGALLYQMLPLLVHFKVNGSSGKTDTTAKTKANLLRNSDSDGTRAAYSHLLLKEFNSSLEIPVKVLEAAQKDNTMSVKPASSLTTSSINTGTRRNSTQQQPIKPRHNQRTPLAAEIQRSTAAKYGNYGVIVGSGEQKKLYFEEFQIDPIRATVSFSFGDSAGAILDGRLSSISHTVALTDLSSSQVSSVITVGPLRLILNAIGTSLSKIANASFHLKALHICNSFVQPDALATRLASHYQSEALRQAYVILGSVDVLGNPMIAWTNVRNGFRDFISKPALGLYQRSPQAFAFGLGRGLISLVRASVYTFLDFNTRILTAFSLGLSEACIKLDEYTGYPATRHIFQGLVQGLSGVVVAPIHSFEINGARGVLPGLIAGAFGLVLKPLLGFSLATASTATTLRDAIDPRTKALLIRVRPPRHIDLRTKRLTIYSYVDSLGDEIVSKIRGGCYRTDGYLGHIDLKDTHQCILVTRKRILFLNVKGTASVHTSKYDVVWELLAEEVVVVDCSKTLEEQIVTFYYMENEFYTASNARTNAIVTKGSTTAATRRRWTPGLPRGMFVHKHEVALPQSKVLFLRAMLQQQDRSLLTKMDSCSNEKHIGSLSSLGRTNSRELNTVWQPQFPKASLNYPIFRIPPSLNQNRSFANLAQMTSSVQNYNI
ncbi:putative vacuolar protein sorting-associated protein [Plasmopara halstedii]